MNEQYNKTIAKHYSAYRPPLHQIILEHALTKTESFSVGLDIGCGTGYSAIALTKYCSQVYGIEPSEAMLQEATPNEKITYYWGSANSIALSESSIDIVTFAGSLFYAKSSELTQELIRVCRKSAIVIAYDFEILLDDILWQHGIESDKSFSYDHQINFSNDSEFTEIVSDEKQIKFTVTVSELAHLMLSSSYNHNALVEKYGSTDIFSTLVNKLNQVQKQQYTLEANIYFSKYQIKKEG